MRKTKWLIPYFFALCAGITDAQYNNFVRVIVFSNVGSGTDMDYRRILIKRGKFVVDNGTPDQITAGKCFLFDLYQLETGIAVSSSTITTDKHGFKHWIDSYSPGDGFLP